MAALGFTMGLFAFALICAGVGNACIERGQRWAAKRRNLKAET